MFETSRFMRRALAATLTASLAIAPVLPATQAFAATYAQINDDSVWLTQPESGTCTLTSATMMVRRAAILNGNLDWRSITVDSMRQVAWYPGLPYSFSYDGIDVLVGWLDGSSHTTQLIELLRQHPEGIVLYYSGYNPHAVLLTDYKDGEFWAVDPVRGYKTTIDQCYHVTIENASQYWYVSSPVAAPDDHELKIDPGWHAYGNDWYVFDENGMPVEGVWTDPDTGFTYLLEEGGKMVRGWHYYKGEWYLLANSGIMQTGWVADGGQWYYFTDNGVMVTGWFSEGNNYYYFNESGPMRRGWVCDNNNWYYLQPSGIMATGWQIVGKTWYHFDGLTGIMSTGLFTDTDGNGYLFEEDGRMVRGWRCVDGAWYYLQPSGIMAKSVWVDGYYLQADGTMATNAYVEGGIHVGADGRVDGSVRAN